MIDKVKSIKWQQFKAKHGYNKAVQTIKITLKQLTKIVKVKY